MKPAPEQQSRATHASATPSTTRTRLVRRRRGAALTEGGGSSVTCGSVAADFIAEHATCHSRNVSCNVRYMDREQFLLVSVSTAGGGASLRVQVWRKLRSLGAVYLHQSV